MRVIIIKRVGKSVKVLMSLVIAAMLIYATYFFLSAKGTVSVFGQPIYKGSGESRTVAFTCNVDWGNEYLPDMLKIFEAAEIKVTFFITGRWADKNPQLVNLIALEGHIIGNHGYSHRDHSKLNYQQNLEEIEKAQEALQRACGKKPGFFAPPSGAYNEHTIKAAGQLGCEVILWSIDTIDWRRDGTDKIVSRVNKRLHNGGIILMHPTDQTVEALPLIIQNIGKEGFEIISLEDIVKAVEKK